MSRTVVNALSRVVAHRTSRRGLLARSAFGATALAVAPVAFTMRPISAHAAICSCANSSCACSDLCCDGFTDFCCKVTGENLCPPHTVVAGWWKADGTGFCDVGDSPRPRYYLDCNHLCEDGCGWTGVCPSSCTVAECHCLEGCDSRSVDCTRFRYGQCNQDIACVGPIACRIVTCVPPWQWDGSCNDTPATDNSTGFHDRPASTTVSPIWRRMRTTPRRWRGHSSKESPPVTAVIFSDPTNRCFVGPLQFSCGGIKGNLSR